jgi:hypothetical protein
MTVGLDCNQVEQMNTKLGKESFNILNHVINHGNLLNVLSSNFDCGS